MGEENSIMNTLYKFPAAPCLSPLEIATRFERTHIFFREISDGAT